MTIRFLRISNFSNENWLACGINYEFFGYPFLILKVDQSEVGLNDGRFLKFTEDEILDYSVSLETPYSYEDSHNFISPIVSDLSTWVRSAWSIEVDFSPIHGGCMAVLFSFDEMLDAMEFKLKWA